MNEDREFDEYYEKQQSARNAALAEMAQYFITDHIYAGHGQYVFSLIDGRKVSSNDGAIYDALLMAARMTNILTIGWKFDKQKQSAEISNG